MAETDVPKPDYNAMTPSDRAFALFTAVEKARSKAIAEMRDEGRGIDYDEAKDEAHQAALAVWNAWAHPLLEERETLEMAGEWNATSEYIVEFQFTFETGKNEYTRNFLSRADLIAHSFNFTEADLSNFSFPGNVSFRNATYIGEAYIRNTTFKSDVVFDSVIFKNYTTFYGTVFEGKSSFNFVTFEDEVHFECIFKGDAFFLEAIFKNVTSFIHSTFEHTTNFSKAIFIGDVDFSGGAFQHNSKFHNATFENYASFNKVTFGGDVYLNSTFKGRATFEGINFMGDANFKIAKFNNSANFSHASFLSNADFSYTTFSLGSDWTAINAVRAFNMAGARFETQVPQFTQAHFTESPRVDNITLPMSGRGHDTLPAPKPETGWVTEIHSWGWAGGERQDETGTDTYHTPYQTKLEELSKNEELGGAPKGEKHQEMTRDGKRYRVRQRNIPLPKPGKPIDKDDIAAFTALRRIAKQGEDHETERKAFKGEMRTQRIAGDHGLPYRLFSWAYDLFTDFGGSFLRPLLLWAALSIASVFIYLIPATSPINKTEQATCDCPAVHALQLSARNALLFATAGQRPFVTKSLDCLYGKEPKEETIQNITRTGPPLWLGLFGTAQTLLSAILIFFILLALRNRFKI